MKVDNLISGIIGALLAVILAEVLKYIQVRRKRSKYREILKSYLKHFVVNGLNRYIVDVNKAIEEINKYPKCTRDLTFYDTLPSLNSNILKQMDFNELFFISKDSLSHAILIETYHCIDYLKAKMPSEFVQEVWDYGDKHFHAKKINRLSEMLKHVETCTYIPDGKSRIIGSLNNKKNTASQVLRRVGELIENL